MSVPKVVNIDKDYSDSVAPVMLTFYQHLTELLSIFSGNCTPDDAVIIE